MDDHWFRALISIHRRGFIFWRISRGGILRKREQRFQKQRIFFLLQIECPCPSFIFDGKRDIFGSNETTDRVLFCYLSSTRSGRFFFLFYFSTQIGPGPNPKASE